MQAEETVSGIKGVLGDGVVILEEIHHPGGIAILEAVTVGTIPHQLTVVNLSQLVNLPIDDGIIPGTAKPVAQGGMHHLAMRQKTIPDDGTAETAPG